MSEETKREDVVVEESAPVVEPAADKVSEANKTEKKNLPPVNDAVKEFKEGSELKVNGLPFKVIECRGLHLVLKRKDIR